MSELIIDKLTTRDGSNVGAIVVADIDELLLLNTNKEINTTAIVKDSNRGGVFNYDGAQSGVNNGGTIFNGWVRQYDGTVNVKWFETYIDGANFITNNESSQLNYIVNSPAPATIPPASSSHKICIKDSGNSFWAITRAAKDSPHYTGIHINNSVGALSSNIANGGVFRVEDVRKIGSAYVAKTSYADKSTGTVLYNASGGGILSDADINEAWGMPTTLSGTVEMYAESVATDNSLNNRDTWKIPTNDHITYRISKGSKAYINFLMSENFSDNIEISIGVYTTAGYAEIDSFSTDSNGTGALHSRRVEVQGATNGSTWYVKVKNLGANPCIIAGCNIFELRDMREDLDIDGTLCMAYSSGSDYKNGAGANELAIRLSDDRWLGTYHGGHSGQVERLKYDDNNNFRMEQDTLPDFFITKRLTLHTASNMGTQNNDAVYAYSATVEIRDGVDITNYSVTHVSGTPLLVDHMYTHMCTTQNQFGYVHTPSWFVETDDITHTLPNCGQITQFRVSDYATLNTHFSMWQSGENNNIMSRVNFGIVYNKQYYGIQDLNIPLLSFNAATSKEYY
jgi:hypothetical protein